MLQAAERALSDRWSEQSAIEQVNRDVSRLADELERDVLWYDQWRDYEPEPDLSVLRLTHLRE